MKDLVDDTYILRIRLYRDRIRKLIGLSQSLYIKKILKMFSMLNSKMVQLLVWVGVHLSKEMSLNTPEKRSYD